MPSSWQMGSGGCAVAKTASRLAIDLLVDFGSSDARLDPDRRATSTAGRPRTGSRSASWVTEILTLANANRNCSDGNDPVAGREPT